MNSETGASQVADLLAQELAKNDQVLYFCLGGKFSIKKQNNLKIVKFPSINIKGVDLPLFTPQAIYNSFKVLENFNPQIVHLHNSIFVSSLIKNWAKLKNIPIVTTFHHIPTEAVKHLIPESKGNIFFNLVQNLYKNVSLKNFLNETDAVIALNKKIYNSIRSIDKKMKVKIINNGLNLDEYLKIQTKKPNSKYVNFLFLGSYGPRKNQGFLVKIFKYLPQKFRLYCYGKSVTNSAYFLKLKKFIKSNNINHVFLNGFVKRETVPLLFRKSDYLISASIKEAQSLTVIQALASGKPIIGIKNETISELVDKSNGMVVSKRVSPREFAKLIVEFIKKDDYIRLSKNSRDKSQKFKIQKVVSETKNFYKSICDSYRKKS
jgi:1,2-diacylglycerol 3-alpha-glucosyltransferase